MSAASCRLFGVRLALLAVLAAAAGAAAQTLEGGPSPAHLPAGGSLRLRCRATGPSGLALRLACPLLTSLWPPVPCFEDCRRPPSAASIPELMSASCELQRRLLSPSGSQAFEEVAIEYEFSNVSQRHIGNYTCQFMLLRAVSLVSVMPATPITAMTTTAATTTSATTTTAGKLTTLQAVRLLTTSRSGTVHGDAGLVTVTMATTSASSIESPDDWFQMEIHGPITLGHVIAVSLSVAIVLLLACLIACLSCYCRRRHQKRRCAEISIPVDGTARWVSVHSLSQQFGGFSAADVVASASATATLAGGTDASWTSPAIYADAEYSPLISGGGSGLRQNGFGSQGVGINTGAVGCNDSNGAGGGSFLNRGQPGRHSFHSVRQHQLVSRGAATATASPVMPTKPLPNQRSPAFSLSSSPAVPDTILQLVAAQRAEIDRLSEQLRSSQKQLNRLAASSTDLQRCLSSKQLNASARLRHESGPQQQQQQQQQPEDDRDRLQVRQLGFAVGGGNVYGSSDVLTVETIDEEFEADGTLKVPARRRQAPLSQPLESLNHA